MNIISVVDVQLSKIIAELFELEDKRYGASQIDDEYDDVDSSERIQAMSVETETCKCPLSESQFSEVITCHVPIIDDEHLNIFLYLLLREHKICISSLLAQCNKTTFHQTTNVTYC